MNGFGKTDVLMDDHLFNGLKGNGCRLSVLGQQLLKETPLPWHVTIYWQLKTSSTATGI